ncbi:acyl-homoserine-lactone synthase [Phaeobacter sp. 11ANDIMAR09]|uniref:acyl-homoserine-lactone synthase n=1 Tax=Phaeobacter sp. 11ANDIMAR09 TaxID=1225647 RepID=UPI0006C8E30B|nr:acyl-homoserine-lactone synthase [Phaeobacter sp. 11ANDIMAR09]
MMTNTFLVDLRDPSSRVDLYADCLRLRKEVFISQMGWNLYEASGCEYDQYDIPASIHLAATLNGVLVGCIRLLRTDSVHSGVTYMILDAHRGKIPNLPQGIMHEELVSESVWEASRLAISTLVPGEIRNQLLIGLVDAARRYVQEAGGVSMLGMMHPAFLRTFRRAGFNVRRFGPTAPQRDGPICVLRWDFVAETSERTISVLCSG